MEKAKEGIDQILKVLDLIIEGGNVADKIGKETTILGKLMAVMPLSDEIIRIISLSPVLLKRQWADLDDVERQEIRVHFAAKFDIADDAVEARLELGLELVAEAAVFCEKMVAYAKTFKKEG